MLAETATNDSSTAVLRPSPPLGKVMPWSSSLYCSCWLLLENVMAAINYSQSRLLAAEFKHKMWMGHSSFALQVGLSIPLPRTSSVLFHTYIESGVRQKVFGIATSAVSWSVLISYRKRHLYALDTNLKVLRLYAFYINI